MARAVISGLLTHREVAGTQQVKNCRPKCSQRACVNHKVTLSRVSHYLNRCRESRVRLRLLALSTRRRADDTQTGRDILVVAGAWNPAILTPPWVLQYGLGRAGTNEPVQIAVPAGQGAIFEFPRFTLPEFAYIVRPDTLIVAPAGMSDAALARAEDAVAAMLENLPHTPVNGVGHNFEFRDPNPDPQGLAVFTNASQDVADNTPQGWVPITTMIASSFRYEDGSTIANVQRQFDGTNTIVKFNFHHTISNVQQALQVLRGDHGYARMQQHFEIARGLVASLYGDVVYEP